MGVTSDDSVFFSVIREIGGDEGAQIATYLSPEQEITDEELGEKTGYKINVVRKILYKLYESHLASYRRIRAKDTGWFVYFWKLNPEKFGDLTKAKKKHLLENLKIRLDYEKSHVFYICVNDPCPRYTFEEAVETSFHCPRCQGTLQHFNNERIVTNLSQQIDHIVQDLSAQVT